MRANLAGRSAGETAEPERAVGVVGVGAQTPVGRSAPASAAAVRAGIDNFAEHPYMTDNAGEPVKVARAPWLPDDLTVTARMLALAEGAAEEALQPLQGATRLGNPSLAVFVGIPTTGPGLSEELARELKERLSESLATGFELRGVETCPNGHAAGVVALQRGWRLIHEGEIDFCLVGGVDSYLGPERLLEIEARKQLHTDDNPWGFVPGEAAGF
ncbi:MAG TPA: beta-ketoacyl synthase N-terminal-like domain-containing protein, partial [Gemmata sp.]|nr:beta-ketoacyl synthase N-terminal-like domain-containing protein [Gemmata sp.]